MQNPLVFFKGIVEGDNLAFIRHEFTQNPSYNPQDDTIFAIGNDPFSEQMVEYRLSFSNYLKQLLGQQRKASMKLLDNNLYSIVPATNKEDYLTSVEDDLRYLNSRLRQTSNSYSESILSELSILERYIDERYRIAEDKTPSDKVVWKGSHETFFALFRALHEEKLIGAGTSKDYLKDVAKLLYNYFEVKPKQGQIDEYTFDSFYQGFKDVKKEKDGDENYSLHKIKRLLQQLD